MKMMTATDNYRKHTSKNPAQRMLLDNFLNTLIYLVSPLDPKDVLDVGCGEGFTLKKFYELKIGNNLEGIDSLETAIKIGKKVHPFLKLQQGSAYKLPYKDDSFDLVICTEVLEHLDNPKKALEEIERVASKFVLLSVPNEPIFMASNFLRGKNWSRWGNDIEHINHWSSSSFQQFIIHNSELRILRKKYPFPWTMILAKKP